MSGTLTLPAGAEMVMPGDNLKYDVELIAPIALEEGLCFAIRDSGSGLLANHESLHPRR